MKLWPFGKRKTEISTTTADSPVAEVREYYNSGRQERQGLAWFLAFATLIATLLIVVGLFFAGRWLYNKIKSDEKAVDTTTTEQTEQGATPSDQSQSATPPSSSTPNSSNSSTTNGGTGSTNTGTSSTNTNNTGGTPTSGSQQNSATAPTTTPRTGDASLPNAGPGDVVAIAGFTAIISGVLYRFVLRKHTEV